MTAPSGELASTRQTELTRARGASVAAAHAASESDPPRSAPKPSRKESRS